MLVLAGSVECWYVVGKMCQGKWESLYRVAWIQEFCVSTRVEAFQWENGNFKWLLLRQVEIVCVTNQIKCTKG